MSVSKIIWTKAELVILSTNSILQQAAITGKCKRYSEYDASPRLRKNAGTETLLVNSYFITPATIKKEGMPNNTTRLKLFLNKFKPIFTITAFNIKIETPNTIKGKLKRLGTYGIRTTVNTPKKNSMFIGFITRPTQGFSFL